MIRNYIQKKVLLINIVFFLLNILILSAVVIYSKKQFSKHKQDTGNTTSQDTGNTTSQDTGEMTSSTNNSGNRSTNTTNSTATSHNNRPDTGTPSESDKGDTGFHSGSGNNSQTSDGGGGNSQNSYHISNPGSEVSTPGQSSPKTQGKGDGSGTQGSGSGSGTQTGGGSMNVEIYGGTGEPIHGGTGEEIGGGTGEEIHWGTGEETMSVKEQEKNASFLFLSVIILFLSFYFFYLASMFFNEKFRHQGFWDGFIIFISIIIVTLWIVRLMLLYAPHEDNFFRLLLHYPELFSSGIIISSFIPTIAGTMKFIIIRFDMDHKFEKVPNSLPFAGFIIGTINFLASLITLYFTFRS